MLDVSINFDQSHWFFPRIIIFSLIILLIIIFYRERKIIANNLKGFSIGNIINRDNSKCYLFVAIIIFYIFTMEKLGELFPNSGYGFLISTIPLLFITSFILESDITKKKIVFISINSILSPLLAWFVLGKMFGITLP